MIRTDAPARPSCAVRPHWKRISAQQAHHAHGRRSCRLNATGVVLRLVHKVRYEQLRDLGRNSDQSASRLSKF